MLRLIRSATALTAAVALMGLPALAQGTSGGSMATPAGSMSSGGMKSGGDMKSGEMKGDMKSGEMKSGEMKSGEKSDMKMGGARFGGTVYKGDPALPLTLSLVVAGGGPKNFHTTTLVKALAGAKAGPELAKLTKQFGAAGVKQYLSVFDFVIADSLKIVTKAGVKLPTEPDPSPTDGKALTTALYQAGVDENGGAFNVEFMLDHLVTHPVHVQVMKDIDAKFGAKADATYHIVTLQVFKDLKAAYKL